MIYFQKVPVSSAVSREVYVSVIGRIYGASLSEAKIHTAVEPAPSLSES